MTEEQVKRKLSDIGYKLVRLQGDSEPTMYAVFDPLPWPVYCGKQFRFTLEEVSRMIEEHALERRTEAENGALSEVER